MVISLPKCNNNFLAGNSIMRITEHSVQKGQAWYPESDLIVESAIPDRINDLTNPNLPKPSKASPLGQTGKEDW